MMIDLLVFPQIQLSSNQDHQNSGTVLLNLWNPFVLDVAQGPRVDDGEADDEDVRLVVRDQSQFVVFFLTLKFKRCNLIYTLLAA
jgi:hypothetical protein